MKPFKLIAAVGFCLMSAACGSTAGVRNQEISFEDYTRGTPSIVGNDVLQGGQICQLLGDGTSIVTISVAANPIGTSAAVQSSLTHVEGDGNCVPKRVNGQMVPLGQAFTQNTDIRYSLANGGMNVAAGTLQGAVAATIMKGNCSGGNCGGAPIVVQSYTTANAGADVAVSGSGGCPTCVAAKKGD